MELLKKAKDYPGKKFRKRIPIFVMTFAFLILLNQISNGETLYFGVSPFDTTMKLNAKYDFSFWKFKAKFDVDIPLTENAGFILIKPDISNLFESFEFIEAPYKVTYTAFNTSIPFSTFFNPAQKVWYATWVGTGYAGSGLIHKTENFSILGSGMAVNASIRIPIGSANLYAFVERTQNGFNFGIGNTVYVFTGEKTGLGFFLSEKNVVLYALIYHSSDSANSFDLVNGMALKTDNFEINIVNDNIDGNDTIIGRVIWKVGGVYVVGRLQGKEVRLDVEFPIW